MQCHEFPVKGLDARTSCGTLEQLTPTRSEWRSGPTPSRTGVCHRCMPPQIPQSTTRMVQRPFLIVTLPGKLSLLLMEGHLSEESIYPSCMHPDHNGMMQIAMVHMLGPCQVDA